jgi:hypothetical protein
MSSKSDLPLYYSIKEQLLGNPAFQLEGFPILQKENTPTGSHFNKEGLADYFIFLQYKSLLNFNPFLFTYDNLENIRKIIPSFISEWSKRMPEIHPIEYASLESGSGYVPTSTTYGLSAFVWRKVKITMTVYNYSLEIKNAFWKILRGFLGKYKVIMVNIDVRDIDNKNVANGYVVLHKDKKIIELYCPENSDENILKSGKDRKNIQENVNNFWSDERGTNLQKSLANAFSDKKFFSSWTMYIFPTTYDPRIKEEMGFMFPELNDYMTQESFNLVWSLYMFCLRLNSKYKLQDVEYLNNNFMEIPLSLRNKYYISFLVYSLYFMGCIYVQKYPLLKGGPPKISTSSSSSSYYGYGKSSSPEISSEELRSELYKIYSAPTDEYWWDLSKLQNIIKSTSEDNFEKNKEYWITKTEPINNIIEASLNADLWKFLSTVFAERNIKDYLSSSTYANSSDSNVKITHDLSVLIFNREGTEKNPQESIYKFGDIKKVMYKIANERNIENRLLFEKVIGEYIKLYTTLKKIFKYTYDIYIKKLFDSFRKDMEKFKELEESHSRIYNRALLSGQVSIDNISLELLLDSIIFLEKFRKQNLKPEIEASTNNSVTLRNDLVRYIEIIEKIISDDIKSRGSKEGDFSGYINIPNEIKTKAENIIYRKDQISSLDESTLKDLKVNAQAILKVLVSQYRNYNSNYNTKLQSATPNDFEEIVNSINKRDTIVRKTDVENAILELQRSSEEDCNRFILVKSTDSILNWKIPNKQSWVVSPTLKFFTADFYNYHMWKMPYFKDKSSNIIYQKEPVEIWTTEKVKELATEEFRLFWIIKPFKISARDNSNYIGRPFNAIVPGCLYGALHEGLWALMQREVLSSCKFKGESLLKYNWRPGDIDWTELSKKYSKLNSWIKYFSEFTTTIIGTSFLADPIYIMFSKDNFYNNLNRAIEQMKTTLFSNLTWYDKRDDNPRNLFNLFRDFQDDDIIDRGLETIVPSSPDNRGTEYYREYGWRPFFPESSLEFSSWWYLTGYEEKRRDTRGEIRNIINRIKKSGDIAEVAGEIAKQIGQFLIKNNAHWGGEWDIRLFEYAFKVGVIKFEDRVFKSEKWGEFDEFKLSPPEIVYDYYTFVYKSNEWVQYNKYELAGVIRDETIPGIDPCNQIVFAGLSKADLPKSLTEQLSVIGYDVNVQNIENVEVQFKKLFISDIKNVLDSSDINRLSRDISDLVGDRKKLLEGYFAKIHENFKFKYNKLYSLLLEPFSAEKCPYLILEYGSFDKFRNFVVNSFKNGDEVIKYIYTENPGIYDDIFSKSVNINDFCKKLCDKLPNSTINWGADLTNFLQNGFGDTKLIDDKTTDQSFIRKYLGSLMTKNDGHGNFEFTKAISYSFLDPTLFNVPPKTYSDVLVELGKFYIKYKIKDITDAKFSDMNPDARSYFTGFQDDENINFRKLARQLVKYCKEKGSAENISFFKFIIYSQFLSYVADNNYVSPPAGELKVAHLIGENVIIEDNGGSWDDYKKYKYIYINGNRFIIDTDEKKLVQPWVFYLKNNRRCNAFYQRLGEVTKIDDNNGLGNRNMKWNDGNSRYEIQINNVLGNIPDLSMVRLVNKTENTVFYGVAYYEDDNTIYIPEGSLARPQDATDFTDGDEVDVEWVKFPTIMKRVNNEPPINLEFKANNFNLNDNIDMSNKLVPKEEFKKGDAIWTNNKANQIFVKGTDGNNLRIYNLKRFDNDDSIDDKILFLDKGYTSLNGLEFKPILGDDLKVVDDDNITLADGGGLTLTAQMDTDKTKYVLLSSGAMVKATARNADDNVWTVSPSIPKNIFNFNQLPAYTISYTAAEILFCKEDWEFYGNEFEKNKCHLFNVWLDCKETWQSINVPDGGETNSLMAVIETKQSTNKFEVDKCIKYFDNLVSGGTIDYGIENQLLKTSYENKLEDKLTNFNLNRKYRAKKYLGQTFNPPSKIDFIDNTFQHNLDRFPANVQDIVSVSLNDTSADKRGVRWLVRPTDDAAAPETKLPVRLWFKNAPYYWEMFNYVLSKIDETDAKSLKFGKVEKKNNQVPKYDGHQISAGNDTTADLQTRKFYRTLKEFYDAFLLRNSDYWFEYNEERYKDLETIYQVGGNLYATPDYGAITTKIVTEIKKLFEDKKDKITDFIAWLNTLETGITTADPPFQEEDRKMEADLKNPASYKFENVSFPKAPGNSPCSDWNDYISKLETMQRLTPQEHLAYINFCKEFDDSKFAVDFINSAVFDNVHYMYTLAYRRRVMYKSYKNLSESIKNYVTNNISSDIISKTSETIPENYEDLLCDTIYPLLIRIQNNRPELVDLNMLKSNIEKYISKQNKRYNNKISNPTEILTPLRTLTRELLNNPYTFYMNSLKGISASLAELEEKVKKMSSLKKVGVDVFRCQNIVRILKQMQANPAEYYKLRDELIESNYSEVMEFLK